MENEGAGGAAAQLCRTCREEIRSGARKCTRCDSYQDWRRFLSMSSSVLALLIALISVLSVVGPTLLAMVQEKRSDVGFVVQEVSADRTIRVFISNRGTRAAALGRAELQIRVSKGPGDPEPQNVVLPLDLVAGSQGMIPAGGAGVLTYSTGLPAAQWFSLGDKDVPDAVLPDGREKIQAFALSIYDFGKTEPRWASLPLPPEDGDLATHVITACYRHRANEQHQRRCTRISELWPGGP